jgi:hypothetical protein
MKLRRRPKRKAEQALDALAGATKIWSELQIGKRAGKGVAKAQRIRLPSILKGKSAKAIGAAAAAGGAGAVVARKLKGDGPQEYTGPPPSAAAEAAVSAPDAPAPPLTVAPEPDPSKGVPAPGLAALRDGAPKESSEPAAGAAALRDGESAASEAADAGTPDMQDAASEKPAAKKPAKAEEPAGDDAP